MAKAKAKQNNAARTGRDHALRYAHVVGWGTEIPKQVMTNDDLSKIIDTNDEWIQARTGIRERRIADERDTAASLGLRAARKALRVANMQPDEIDLIVTATSSPQYLFPSTASLIQDKLGATNAGAFDVLAACSGFIYALGLAASQVRSGAVDTAIVIGTEVLSRILDWSDRGTAILFGDGAGAFVLQASNTPGGVREYVIHSDGSGGDLLFAKSGARPTTYANGKHPDASIVEMNGREVFRFATRVMASATREVIEQADLTINDIDVIVPHQANSRIIQAAARGLNLTEDKFIMTVDKYANTSTASIPMALVEAVENGRIKRNDRLVLVGFGGGLTWGAAIVEWDVEPQPVSPRGEAERQIRFWTAPIRSLMLRLLRFLESRLFGSPTPYASMKDIPKKPRDNKKKK